MQEAVEVRGCICICCPLGCTVEVSLDAQGGVAEVSGNRCAKGARYAADEITAPVRQVTAAICIRGSLEPLSVKTAGPIPKASLHAALAEIAALRLAAPVRSGEVLIGDVCKTGVPVVATKDIL